MFIIAFSATNNDTYATNEMILKQNPIEDTEYPDIDDYEMIFDELPSKEKIEEMVKNTYDGVWEPIIDSIRVFKVEEIELK